MMLILASASPRRAQILSDAGIPFEALVIETDETPRAGETAAAMTLRLAEAKARAAAARMTERGEPAVVLGADTAVEVDGEIFGKPESAAHAQEMLTKLNGRRHRVVTGIAVIRLPDGASLSDTAVTDVWFAKLTPETIAEYAATNEPLGKAGGYAIQGLAGRFVDRIDGCYFNVVGLPLSRVYRMLTELGWEGKWNS